jgi:small subunit ribosomal protein S20
MPNHKSAKKRVRQNEKRRAVNRSNRSGLRTQIKKLRSAIGGTDQTLSLELLNPTVSAIDKAVNKGILHRNTAARYKSRLTGHVNDLTAPPAAAASTPAAE